MMMTKVARTLQRSKKKGAVKVAVGGELSENKFSSKRSSKVSITKNDERKKERKPKEAALSSG